MKQRILTFLTNSFALILCLIAFNCCCLASSSFALLAGTNPESKHDCCDEEKSHSDSKSSCKDCAPKVGSVSKELSRLQEITSHAFSPLPPAISPADGLSGSILSIPAQTWLLRHSSEFFLERRLEFKRILALQFPNAPPVSLV